MTYITTIDNSGMKPVYNTYETNIDLVLTKGTRKKAIGKTGHFSQLVKSVSSKAPNYYKLYDQDNVLVDHYLTMASLKAGMQRRGIVAVKTKKETIAQAYERGYKDGYNEWFDNEGDKI